MASSARMFFAGVGTTFAIVAVGFGGGLLIVKSALHNPPDQSRARAEPSPSPGVRVILPASAEPALRVTAAVPSPEPQPQIQPAHEPPQKILEKEVERADPKKVEKDLKAERRRHAERKARRMAAERARQRIEPQHRQEPGIMAFGDDEPRTNFFGN
jgi:hypothetical protein